MTIRIRPDFSGFNLDFSGLHRAFAEMGAAIRAMGEGLDRVTAAVTRPPVPRAASSLSTAYHRRHVRNRRRRR